MAWAAMTLVYAAGGGYGDKKPEDRRGNREHVVFVADLSPSMFLKDAGPDGSQTRIQRMADVVDAVLKRIDGNVIYSVMGFYTDCMPVIVDAEDSELVRNVFAGLPVWYAMPSGKTDLGTGVRKALERLAEYPAGNTTLFICTDGDTIEVGSIPKPPSSVRSIYVLGVGDQEQGTFIDGHMSRQEPAVLRSLAGRLRGEYVDVNEKHMPTLTLGTLAASAAAVKTRYGLVDVAILVVAIASAVHALIPVLLQWFGSDWKAVRVERRAAAEGLAR
jgi:Ca-activated chloride channel family protein